MYNFTVIIFYLISVHILIVFLTLQGPLPETFGDLWRMLWEQRSCTIVMMTKLEERTRIKCDQYWPARMAATETYGIMHVTLTDVQELATYTVRTFQLQKVCIEVKIGEEEEVFSSVPPVFSKYSCLGWQKLICGCIRSAKPN